MNEPPGQPASSQDGTERASAGAPGPTAPRIVDAWCARDHTGAVLPEDHRVIEATRALRTLIVTSLARDPPPDDRDLLHAFGALGRMMAQADASPTLAAACVDGLFDVLAIALPTHARTGRAAMVESYLHARVAGIQAEAVRAWDYPACTVLIEKGCIAIAAGYPDGGDAVEEWAARVVQGAALAGVRRAVVSGSERAVDALEEALAVAGIALVGRYVGPAPKERTQAAF